MKTIKSKGVTLIEMAVVIGIIILLTSVSTISAGYYRDWKKGVAATDVLQQMYMAQRLYLSDFPTQPVTGLTKAQILSYVRGKPKTVPKVKSLKGKELTIDFQVSPPVLKDGSVVYDPTGAGDGLWDIK